MVKKIGMIVSMFLMVAFGTGCQHVESSAGNVVDIGETDFSDLNKMKKGMDCAHYFLIFPWGSQNLANIVRNSSLKSVKYLERHTTHYFVYGKQCLVAYGT